MDVKEAEDLLSKPFDELLALADNVRREGIGDRIELCGIINAKSGVCSEDCKFCAQSAHYFTDAEKCSLKSGDEMIAAAGEAKKNGAERFGIVTSGNRLDSGEIDAVADTVKAVKEKVGIAPCASLGALDEASFAILRKAGLSRYHHNVETSERFYPGIVTTHDHSERVDTVKAAKRMGFEVCSGGIIGMGEAWRDRIEMAMLLKELDVDSVPLNFLIPIKGTPLENAEMIPFRDAVRTIALFRIILGDKAIKVAAGRESVLGERQDMMYMAGANGMMVGGYLTIAGRSVEDDLALVEGVRRLWNGE